MPKRYTSTIQWNYRSTWNWGVCYFETNCK